MNGSSEVQIPETCKAGVVTEWGKDFKIAIEDVPVPEPNEDEILIKLHVTGICHSDIHFMSEDLALPRMSEFGVRSPGHEGVGEVVKVGTKVKNWALGDRAGIKPIYNICGVCDRCLNGKESYCTDLNYTGLMKTGTFQQYIVSPANYATPIPNGVDDAVAAPIMCGGTTIYRSLTEARLTPGDWVVIAGSGGGVGIQGVQIAKAMGYRVIGIDTGERKRLMCLGVGADVFIDYRISPSLSEDVVRVADGIGAHGVIVTAPAAYADAVAMTGSRIGARIMCIGMPSQLDSIIGAPPAAFVMQNLTVSGTLVGDRVDAIRVLDFAKRGLLKQTGEVFPLEELPQAIQALQNEEVAGRIVIDFNA